MTRADVSVSGGVRARARLLLSAGIVGAAACLVFAILWAVTVGSMDISITDVYRVIAWELFHPAGLEAFGEGSVRNVVWLVRLPRVVLGAGVGMSLACCGAVMQAIVKNPLADPYVLGISSGASLGATVALGLGAGTALGALGVGGAAFAGTLAVSALVLIISNLGGPANSVKLVLSGVAIGALCSAVSNFVIYIVNDPNVTQSVSFWTLGSLAGATWPVSMGILAAGTAGTAFFWTQSRVLDLMLLGDDASITLGVPLGRMRKAYLAVTSLLVAVCVYASGTIGFVGLVIPHAVRMVSGSSHRGLVPLSALAGGVFVVLADVLARAVIPGSEMPIGILISLVGAPAFIYMMVRRTYGFGGGRS